MVKSKNISFQDLDEYCNYIHSNQDLSLSLNEFIQDKYNLASDIRADLSEIIFDQNHRIDLTNANLSNVILDNVDFNGENIVLKGADLRGASTNNTKFTNYINLEGVNFANIILERNKFSLCQLKGAIYKPFITDNKEVKVTDKILEEFLSEKISGLSLNYFIAKKLGIEEGNVIANLSGYIIDDKFSDVDISGSNISNCQITGKIRNLVIKDCKILNTSFYDLEMENCDLRGANLASNLGNNLDKGAVFGENVVFTGGKFSLPNKNVNELMKQNLLASARGSDFAPLYGGVQEYNISINGDVEFDPVYNKNLNIQNEYVKKNRSDFERYAQYCQETNKSEIKTISEFLGLKANEVADFSNQDLRGIALTYGKIDRCNFSFCKFAGSDFSNSEFKNSNLVSTSFYEEKRQYLFFTTGFNNSKLDQTSFIDCDLTSADLSKAEAFKINLTNVKAVNMKADAIRIQNGILENSDLSGSSWKNSNAYLSSRKCNWSFTDCYKTNFKDADLKENEFCNIYAYEANFEGASLSFSDLENGNLSYVNAKNTKLDHAKLQSALLEGARISGTILNDTDISDLRGRLKSDKDVDFSLAISCEEQIRYAKQQKEAQIEKNKNKIYNQYCKNIAFTTIVIAISIPLLLPLILPASIAAVVMPIVFTPLIIASTVAVVAAGADYLASKIGYSLFSKEIANKIGAEKYIEKVNAPLQEEVTKLNQGYKLFIEEIRIMPSKENKIIDESKGRHKDTEKKWSEIAPKPKTQAKSFVEKTKSEPVSAKAKQTR